MAMSLQKKTAVITGAGSGIGRATALRFAREGANVLVVDIDGDAATKVCHEISGQGGLAEPLNASVATDDNAHRIVSRALELWKRVDVLVNNAASFRHRRVEEATREDWEEVLSVNVMGSSFCSKHAVEAMKRQGEGAIVHVASINGLIAMPEWVTYNASKAAIVEMSKSMAMDLAPFNIRVNCVCPGVIRTPALDRLIAEFGIPAEEVLERYVAPRCLMKRYGRPEEIAAAILFLASDEASFMTGATMVVDGGFTT
jgi:NAD(P)-dependent dehydrogenase (short-subunit alcohol dehydrogenase family)